MPFPYALLRTTILFFIVITNTISSALSIFTFRERTGGAFQVLVICFDTVSLLTVVGCSYHQFARQDEEANNTRNLYLFGICGLLNFALAISLTVHARHYVGKDVCHDFVNANNPCVCAGVQLGMVYASPVLALVGFIISWIDKFPGAVKVTPRYPITKAPSSHFAAYAHDLDENYTRPPVRMSSRSLNNSGWSNVALQYC